MEKIQIPKLKGKSNWSVWKLQIESTLQYHDFEGVLTGVVREPEPLHPEATNQQKRDFEASLKLYKKSERFCRDIVNHNSRRRTVTVDYSI
jgi:hypothetical protein